MKCPWCKLPLSIIVITVCGPAIIFGCNLGALGDYRLYKPEVVCSRKVNEWMLFEPVDTEPGSKEWCKWDRKKPSCAGEYDERCR